MYVNSERDNDAALAQVMEPADGYVSVESDAEVPSGEQAGLLLWSLIIQNVKRKLCKILTKLF